jgi:phenylpropionate dioxygenase-like ring-hydroxylating dioxygenase large terminal subunit
MRYLRNAWYVAAWADGVVGDTVLARKLLGEPVALFRRRDGSPAALRDRCPHRFAPLSAGILSEDQIMCRYHGLRFDGQGHCTHNPHGAATKSLNVQSWPVVDAYRATWIWMGDPSRADPKLIPPMDYLGDAPETAFSSGQLLSGVGHYELFSDNILDLSHTDYLHPNTLGGGAITRTKQQIEEAKDFIEVTWYSANTAPSPLVRSLIQNMPERTDVFQTVRWYAPSVMRLVAGIVETGRPISEAFANTNAHIMTPETDSTTHYFFAATRNYKTEDAELNARLAKTRANIFATEDKPMIALVQQSMGNVDFWDLKPRLMPIDEASVRVRRKLAKLIDADETHSLQA